MNPPANPPAVADSPATPDTGKNDARTRLLKTAGPVFASLGYDRATLRDICGAADVNVASVAYYFGDKMGLYRAVVQNVREAREQRFPTPNNTAKADPEVALVKIIHTILSRMLTGDDSGWEAQLLLREMDRPTAVFKELVQEFFRPLFDQLTSTLARLIHGDSGDANVPEHVLEQLALSVVGQCLYYRVGRGVIEILIPADRQEEHFQFEHLCRHIAAVTISAAKNNALRTNKQRVAETLQKIHNERS